MPHGLTFLQGREVVLKHTCSSEDPSSVPSTCAGQLTTACSSHTQNSLQLMVNLCVSLCVHVCMLVCGLCYGTWEAQRVTEVPSLSPCLAFPVVGVSTRLVCGRVSPWLSCDSVHQAGFKLTAIRLPASAWECWGWKHHHHAWAGGRRPVAGPLSRSSWVLRTALCPPPLAAGEL